MKNSVLINNEDIICVGEEWIDQLKKNALNSPNNRARLCLHNHHNDLVQEMIIAMTKDCVFTPHKHINKTESFHIIEGELYIIIFSEDGIPFKLIKLSSNRTPGTALCYRMCASFWHAVYPITDIVIFHETTTGPFVQGDSEFAPFAPHDKNNLSLYLQNCILTF